MRKIFECDFEFNFTRQVLLRSIAFIYFVGFIILFNQATPLFGESGILPANLFIERVDFWRSPSVFHWYFSDTFLDVSSFLGILISFLLMLGVFEKRHPLFSFISWFYLWCLYLSFINIGQVFYGYGWETMLVETRFLAIFLGHPGIKTSAILIWLFRWVCFRNMFGSGLIKVRGDECWRDLTCMFQFYETQPIPNFLSIYFHHLPEWIHRGSVLLTHFVELIVPWGFLVPFWRISSLAALITIGFQGIIILSGNLAWLNYLSIVLCLSCFSDRFFRVKKDAHLKLSKQRKFLIYSLAIFVAWRSYYPVTNMISSRQSMNRGYDPFHLVNTYGAFGSVTKKRNELVVMGTLDKDPMSAQWREYEFKGKPTDIKKSPPLMSPYHWHLDWQMWFAAFGRIDYSPWVANFVAKLLNADPKTLSLLGSDPFKGEKPQWIKIDYYQYKMDSLGSANYWQREYLGTWLRPVSSNSKNFTKYLKLNGR